MQQSKKVPIFDKIFSTVHTYRLAIILLSAFLIRLVGLQQSLWLDEGTTAKVVQQYSLFNLIRSFSLNDFHPPLYYWFMQVWSGAWGFSEFALRMPSIIFSLLSGFFIYKIARHIDGENTGLLACALFLFNPLIIYYSQEARMYMMMMSLLSGATYGVYRLKTHDSWQLKILTGLALSFAFATFYGSIFYICALLLLVCIHKRYSSFFTMCIVVGIVTGMLLPLILTQLSHSHTALSSISGWQHVLGTVTLKNLLLIPLKFTVGRISFEPKWFYWTIGSVCSLVLGLISITGYIKEKGLVYLSIVPLAAGVVFSIFSPLLSYFRFLYVLIPFSIALAIGLKDKLRIPVFSIVLLFSCVYLFVPSYHRENWKELARSIPKGMAVYAIPSSMDALRYYRPHIHVYDIRTLAHTPTPKTFVIIPYTSEIYGVTVPMFANQRQVFFRGVSAVFIAH